MNKLEKHNTDKNTKLLSNHYKNIMIFKPVNENSTKIFIVKYINQKLSFKKGVNVCRAISGENFEIAANKLYAAQIFSTPIPFMRHKGGVGHKKNMGPGRYCVKFCKFVINAVLLNQSWNVSREDQ